MSIRLLDPMTINRIAAGEVVDVAGQLAVQEGL